MVDSTLPLASSVAAFDNAAEASNVTASSLTGSVHECGREGSVFVQILRKLAGSAGDLDGTVASSLHIGNAEQTCKTRETVQNPSPFGEDGESIGRDAASLANRNLENSPASLEMVLALLSVAASQLLLQQPPVVDGNLQEGNTNSNESSHQDVGDLSNTLIDLLGGKSLPFLAKEAEGYPLVDILNSASASHRFLAQILGTLPPKQRSVFAQQILGGQGLLAQGGFRVAEGLPSLDGSQIGNVLAQLAVVAEQGEVLQAETVPGRGMVQQQEGPLERDNAQPEHVHQLPVGGQPMVEKKPVEKPIKATTQEVDQGTGTLKVRGEASHAARAAEILGASRDPAGPVPDKGPVPAVSLQGAPLDHSPGRARNGQNDERRGDVASASGKPASTDESSHDGISKTITLSGNQGLPEMVHRETKQAADVQEPPSPSLTTSIVEQIISRSRLLAARGRGGISIQLEPKELGKVQVHVSVGPEGLHVRMAAEASATKDIIQAALPQLKATFENQGLVVERFDVAVGTGLASFNSAQDGAQRQGMGVGHSPGRYSGNEDIGVEATESAELGAQNSLVDYRI